MKRVMYLTLLFIFVFLSICLPFSAAASPDGTLVSFTVQAVIPHNQIDHSLTYFDLLMTPSEKQDLRVKISNSGPEAVDVLISLNYATTNVNGIIDYSVNDPELKDASLKYPLPSIAALSASELTIPPNSTVPVTVTVTMPEEKFDGVILGSLRVQQAPSAVRPDQEGVGINNAFAYMVSIQLRENDVPVAPELDLLSVGPSQVNDRTAVVANIQNKEANITRKLTVAGEVYERGSAVALYTASKDNVTMAPNSNFDFSIDWEGESIRPGAYRLHLTARNMDGSWEWDEPFTITATDIAGINQEAAGITDHNYTAWYISGGILFLTLFSWILFLSFRRERSGR